MDQPKSAIKAVITAMAKRLRRKVVDMEEYLEENQALLDPTQRRRLAHMNDEAREQLERMKKAWANRKADVKFDKVYIDEVNVIIADAEDDVREIIEESRKIMDMPNVSPSSAACAALRESGLKIGQKPRGSDDKDKDIHMRKVGTKDMKHEGVVEQRRRTTKQTLGSVRATVDMLMAAQEGIQNRRAPPEVEGSDRKKAGGDTKRGTGTAVAHAGRTEGEKINPRKTYTEEGEYTANHLMADAMREILRDGKEFEETFKKWRKTRQHNDAHSTRQNLQSSLAEWKKGWTRGWNSQKGALTLDPDYGVIKLRYCMAKNSLRGALARIEVRKEEKRRYEEKINNKRRTTERNYTDLTPSSGRESTSGESSEESGTDVDVQGGGELMPKYRGPERDETELKKRAGQSSRRSTDYHSYGSTSGDDSENENSRANKYKAYSRNARRKNKSRPQDKCRGVGEGMLEGNTTNNNKGSEHNGNFDLIINEDTHQTSEPENEDYKVIINKQKDIVKLPNGVSRAYIDRGDDGKLTRIDFPDVSYNQYWQMVSLIPTHKTVMIHPTIPPMKVELLKRKASSPGNVTNESYTPMKAQGEVDSFGVYESNTTRTHIFVGPFTIKRKKEETITPGTPDTTTAEEDSEEERQYPTPDEMGIAAPCCKYSRVHPYIISGPYIAMCKKCKTRATIYYDTDNAYSTEGAEDDAETKERPPIGSPSDEGLRDTGSVRARRAVAGERDRKKPKTQRPRPNRPPENTNTGEQTNANPAQHTPGTDTTGNARADGSTKLVFRGRGKHTARMATTERSDRSIKYKTDRGTAHRPPRDSAPPAQNTRRMERTLLQHHRQVVLQQTGNRRNDRSEGCQLLRNKNTTRKAQQREQ